MDVRRTRPSTAPSTRDAELSAMSTIMNNIRSMFMARPWVTVVKPVRRTLMCLSSQQDCISLALRAPWRDATYVCERGVLSEYPAARARASYWFDNYVHVLLIVKTAFRARPDGCVNMSEARRSVRISSRARTRVLLARRCLACSASAALWAFCRRQKAKI